MTIMIGVPAVVLTIIGIIFFLILLFIIFIPNFLAGPCSSHEVGYQYVCKLAGRGW